LDKKGNVDNSLPLRLQVENKSIEGSRRKIMMPSYLVGGVNSSQ